MPPPPGLPRGVPAVPLGRAGFWYSAPMLQALVFDFDGVIVDSEPLHYRAFAQVAQAACGLRRTTGLRRAPRCQRGDQGLADPSLPTT